MKLNKEAERIAEQLRMAVEAARIGSWYIHPETKALEYNDVLAEIYGYTREEPMTYEDAIGQVSEEFRLEIREAIAVAIRDGGHYDITFSQHRFDNNELIWLRSTGRVIRDEMGNYSMFSGIVMEITNEINDKKALEKANRELTEVQFQQLETYSNLIKSQDDLKFAIDAAGLGTFDFNPRSGRFAGNDLLKYWFGLNPDEEIELSKATDVIMEQDRLRVLDAIQKALNFKLGGNYDIEYTIINPKNPEPRVVRAKGKALFDDQGQPTRLSGTVQDITDQKRDEIRKNDFIGMVSHELKTPLTSINAYIQLMQNRAKKNGDEFGISSLDKANVQIKKMTNMINSFLNVSRLESSQIYIDKQVFDLADLLKEIEEETVTTNNSHRLVFEQIEPIEVKADHDKIGQVLSNLISNAVKYSPTGSTITVSSKIDNAYAQVSVTDEGMGIAEKDLKHLFDRYYRVEGEQMRSISGFGIGLYLCAEIIQRHDGKIWVTSKSGEGSTFVFSLPIHTPTDADLHS
ncbi:PAS domain-containing sensor histidine kinase [Pedobacter sp. PWIIR3]